MAGFKVKVKLRGNLSDLYHVSERAVALEPLNGFPRNFAQMLTTSRWCAQRMFLTVPFNVKVKLRSHLGVKDHMIHPQLMIQSIGSIADSLCLKLLPQFSSYLNETCYTWSQWRVNVHDTFFVRPDTGVPELCSILEILLYSYSESLCLKPLPQFSSPRFCYGLPDFVWQIVNRWYNHDTHW